MKVQVQPGKYIATFEPEDFPKSELLENREYIFIPESYNGTSEDPYLIMAFNNALKRGKHLLLYSDSVLVTENQGNAIKGIEALMMIRFDMHYMGSGIALETAYKTILPALQKRKIIKTNIQIYHYLIAELLEQAYLFETTKLDALKYEDFKNYFQFMSDDRIVLTTLPSLEELYKYRLLTQALVNSLGTYRYDASLNKLFEKSSSQLWQNAQLLSLENIEYLNKIFKDNRNSGCTEEAFFELTKMFIQNPEETRTLLEQTPQTWLTKLLGGNIV
jgi:hypothetical protein